jgi:hypothetical protein
VPVAVDFHLHGRFLVVTGLELVLVGRQFPLQAQKQALIPLLFHPQSRRFFLQTLQPFVVRMDFFGLESIAVLSQMQLLQYLPHQQGLRVLHTSRYTFP